MWNVSNCGACSFKIQLKRQLFVRLCWQTELEMYTSQSSSVILILYLTPVMYCEDPACPKRDRWRCIWCNNSVMFGLTGTGRGWRSLWWGRSKTDCGPECTASARPRRRPATTQRERRRMVIVLIMFIMVVWLLKNTTRTKMASSIPATLMYVSALLSVSDDASSLNSGVIIQLISLVLFVTKIETKMETDK